MVQMDSAMLVHSMSTYKSSMWNQHDYDICKDALVSSSDGRSSIKKFRVGIKHGG